MRLRRSFSYRQLFGVLIGFISILLVLGIHQIDFSKWREYFYLPKFFTNKCSLASFNPSSKNASQTRDAFRRAFIKCTNKTVVVPAGTWKTGGITLPSNTTLFLEEGATVIFDPNPEYYLPAVTTRFEGMDVINYQPLIYIPNAENVTISGKGTFVGNGESWWGVRENKRIEGGMDEKDAAKALYKLVETGTSLEDRVFASMKQPLRPSFVQPYKSKNIVIQGVTFTESPMWTVHPLYSENIVIRDITVDTQGRNTDGIAIDSSQNILIEDSRIGSGDDAIVIKSGLDQDGWRQGEPSKNILIRNTTVFRGNGGIVIGSEMSGGVENLSVESVTFTNVDTGIRLKTLKSRGGYIRDISFRNVIMKDVIEDAIKLDATYSSATFSSTGDRHPEIQNISMEDIHVYGASRAIRIDGGEFGFSRITLRNAEFYTDSAGKINDVSGLVLEDIEMQTEDTAPLEFRDVTLDND